jgi:hypothetical protein
METRSRSKRPVAADAAAVDEAAAVAVLPVVVLLQRAARLKAAVLLAAAVAAVAAVDEAAAVRHSFTRLRLPVTRCRLPGQSTRRLLRQAALPLRAVLLAALLPSLRPSH